MSSYSTQTVAQLKELLKGRGLSTSGVKSDLIARLEEADKSSSEDTGPVSTAETPAVEKKSEEVATDATAPQTEPDVNLAEEKAPTDSTEGEEAAAAAKGEEKEEPKKQLAPEERKTAAIELIQKRIARAKKFGSEDDVAKAEKDLARVERFGVDLGTALAREIGLASSEGLKERPRHRKGFKSRGHFKGRGGSNNRR